MPAASPECGFDRWLCRHQQLVTGYADVPYELTPDFLEELFTKHRIDYVVHGDDPCLLPDGTDAYAHAKEMGRFKMVGACVSLIHGFCCFTFYHQSFEESNRTLNGLSVSRHLLVPLTQCA